jgi:hypothetical protein
MRLIVDEMYLARHRLAIINEVIRKSDNPNGEVKNETDTMLFNISVVNH